MTSPLHTVEGSLEVRDLACEATEYPPFAPANLFEFNDGTTLGGMSMWLQDADYPRCPVCAERIRLLAQHDNSALEEEGIYYALYCPDCGIVAVNYQQT